MSRFKSALGFWCAAALWVPAIATAQHAVHELQALPQGRAPLKSVSASPHHRKHSQPQLPADPELRLREPIPTVTDADRAAAFPELEVELSHGHSSHSYWRLDELELADGYDDTAISWDGTAWIGGDLNRLWLRSEGSAVDGGAENGHIEALYGRAVLPWWDVVSGLRQDFGQGPSRTWAALGIQGLAPYFFNIEATAYVGESGRTALSLEANYDMLLTNRLILTWKAEANAFGKSDIERAVGSGLNTSEFGLRLRYEINRQFAPYIGFEREWSFGETADLRALADQVRNDSKWLVGVRLWF